MKRSFWVLKKAIRFCFPYIFVNIFLVALSTAFNFLINLVNKNIVNELAKGVEIGILSKTFIGLLISYLLLYTFQRVYSFLGAFGNNFYRLKVDELFHSIFMYKSNITPQEKFFDPKFMELYSFVNKNTNKISSYIDGLIQLLFANLGTVFGSIVIFAVYEPFLIIYISLTVLLSFGLNGYFSRKEYELEKRQIAEQRFSNYYRGLLTDRKPAKELRIYKTQRFFYEKWQSIYQKLRLEKLDLDLKKIKLGNLHAILRLASRIIAVFLLLIGVYHNRYDLGTFVMLFTLSQNFIGQAEIFAKIMMRGGYKNVKYLNDYFDFVTPITNNEIKSIKKNFSAVKDVVLPFGNFQELEVNDASFTYPSGDKFAVENVSFRLRKGEIVSILGYNGSGKTTLSKLITGSIVPQTGTITLNGVPITTENQQSLFHYFGIAPQEFPRFAISIRDVVGLGQIEEIDNQEMIDSAYRKANLIDFISQYPLGEHTVLGKQYDENGVDLSGGEWQRLTIASAYMGQPEILILDEPTASIDPLKEMEMIKDLRKNLEGKTAILISHRIGFARLADRIIVMSDGKIREQGTHQELLNKNGSYAAFFCAQKELYEEK